MAGVYIFEQRPKLTKIPALENATGMARIPVPTFPLIMCMIVEKFLQIQKKSSFKQEVGQRSVLSIHDLLINSECIHSQLLQQHC